MRDYGATPLNGPLMDTLDRIKRTWEKSDLSNMLGGVLLCLLSCVRPRCIVDRAGQKRSSERPLSLLTPVFPINLCKYGSASLPLTSRGRFEEEYSGDLDSVSPRSILMFFQRPRSLMGRVRSRDRKRRMFR